MSQLQLHFYMPLSGVHLPCFLIDSRLMQSFVKINISVWQRFCTEPTCINGVVVCFTMSRGLCTFTTTSFWTMFSVTACFITLETFDFTHVNPAPQKFLFLLHISAITELLLESMANVFVSFSHLAVRIANWLKAKSVFFLFKVQSTHHAKSLHHSPTSLNQILS